MTKTPLVVAVATVLLGVTAWAQENPDMTAAQQELQSAKSHLEAAGHDYGGHRKAAIEHVNKALQDVREGLATVEHKEKKVEKKEEKAQKKADNLKARDQKLKTQ